LRYRSRSEPLSATVSPEEPSERLDRLPRAASESGFGKASADGIAGVADRLQGRNDRRVIQVPEARGAAIGNRRSGRARSRCGRRGSPRECRLPRCSCETGRPGGARSSSKACRDAQSLLDRAGQVRLVAGSGARRSRGRGIVARARPVRPGPPRGYPRPSGGRRRRRCGPCIDPMIAGAPCDPARSMTRADKGREPRAGRGVGQGQGLQALFDPSRRRCRRPPVPGRARTGVIPGRAGRARRVTAGKTSMPSNPSTARSAAGRGEVVPEDERAAAASGTRLIVTAERIDIESPRTLSRQRPIQLRAAWP